MKSSNSIGVTIISRAVKKPTARGAGIAICMVAVVAGVELEDALPAVPDDGAAGVVDAAGLFITVALDSPPSTCFFADDEKPPSGAQGHVGRICGQPDHSDHAALKRA